MPDQLKDPNNESFDGIANSMCKASIKQWMQRKEIEDLTDQRNLVKLAKNKIRKKYDFT